ncbi:hypothetical protein V8D89_005124 [Ganoderma adspersum]
MIDISTTSQSQSSTSRPRTRRIDTGTRPNPEPTLAFGFVLDHQCRLQRERRLGGLSVAIITAIPNRVYHALPDGPRVRKDLLPIEHPRLGFDDFAFVLRDNSTAERLHSPLTPEHTEAIRKALGLPDGRQPKWVRIPVYV